MNAEMKTAEMKAEIAGEIEAKLAKKPVRSFLTAEQGLSIHTKPAQGLCQGGWEYRKMGLFQFAGVMLTVHNAKHQDDPYAEWHILKVQEHLFTLKQNIQTAIADYEQKIQQRRGRGLEIRIFGAQNPMKLLLNFACPAGYMAADTLGELDYLLRQAFTFRQIGIFPEFAGLAKQLFWEFKMALAQSRQWKHTGVTRQDIRETNQKAQRAQSKMGEIPAHILDKSHHSTQK